MSGLILTRSPGHLASVLSQRFAYKVLDLAQYQLSLRQGCVGGAACEPGRSGSVSHVFRKHGVHIVADAVAEVVADDAYFTQPAD
jgi:hypothetical protein